MRPQSEARLIMERKDPLREDIEYMEPIRLIDARAAQDEIIRIMARLEEQGEIMLVRNRDERMLE